MGIVSRAELPDGLFSNQKSQFGYNLEGFGKENVVIFYDHLEYVTTIWYRLWPFGIVFGQLVYIPVLVCLDQEKSGNPGRTAHVSNLLPIIQLK
jgi:hypothetical protein